MHWPHSGIRRARNLELEERLAAARRDTPESEAWLRLLEAALKESEVGGVWDAVVPEPAAERPVKAPLLWSARIPVDGPAARRWVRRLLTLARPPQARRLERTALLD